MRRVPLTMIDERRALLVECDNGQADPSRACAERIERRQAAPCFAMPARRKRIHLVNSGSTDAEGFLRICRG